MTIKLAISVLGDAKVRMPLSRVAEVTSDEEVEVAINTSRPNYVPDKVRVCARVDDTLFTTRTTGRVLAELERDPLVVSVEGGRALRPYRGR